MKPRYGLVGQPVAHSRSPAIHRAFAAQRGRELEFSLLECAPEALATTITDFFAAGGRGLNVTLPHKGPVMDLCAELSEDARSAGAVNTLVPRGADIAGFNTDGRGLVADLERLGIAVTGRRIAVLGAGGAARGILRPLLELGPGELVWSNRSPWKVQEQEADFATFGPLRACTHIALKGDRFDLIINATSAGHRGTTPWLPHRPFTEGGVAYDLSYGAAAGPFLAWAEAEGAAARHDGFGMLIEQAALAFFLWTGETPDTAPLHATLNRG